jgi:hypothetical protein
VFHSCQRLEMYGIILLLALRGLEGKRGHAGKE